MSLVGFSKVLGKIQKKSQTKKTYSPNNFKTFLLGEVDFCWLFGVIFLDFLRIFR